VVVTYAEFDAVLPWPVLPWPLLDAEASTAIMATRTDDVTASVTIFGNRCAVLPLRNCLNEPLFMRNKFTDSNHTSTY